MQEIIAQLSACLEERRRRLDDEIRHYPTPIPRCDAQFNALYEQRAQISRELQRLEALGAGDATVEDLAPLIGKYLDRPADAAD
ncbi:MAG TPA: hypothetical protein VN878_06510 [Usitatibacter sp.]|nr:hypothetical protein [Usitatibacter sp.]